MWETKFRPQALVGAAWFGWWNLMRRYHRFEVVGLERLERAGAALLVGYHGRAAAHDLIMLQALLRERTGRMPRAIVHATFHRAPLLRWLAAGADFLDGDEASIAAAVARGDQIIVTPGGLREACRSFRDRYRVSWSGRLGYLRLALRHRLPIIPIAASGVDDTYVGMNDGHAWGKRLGVPGRLPLWLGLGPVGPWPLSPPFPVRITQYIGAPIDPVAEVGADGDADDERLTALHHRVAAAVQALLDRARAA